MRVVIFSCVISLLACSCSALFNRDKAIAYLQRQLDKQGPENRGAEPDYRDLRYWAASPFSVDSSDILPVGVSQPDGPFDADVFFIHPTTYISAHGNTYELSELAKHPLKGIRILKKSPWNADVDDETVNIKTDNLSLANQATAFNESCRVFAPRYRQANIKAFMVPEASSNAIATFDLAYQDVKKAFEYYLENHHEGRPIVIAAHSQGTLLATRLLKEFFDGKPLLDRLVCAYLIGYKVSPDAFKTIPVGNRPEQTGCVVGWQSFNADATFTEEELAFHGGSIAVNPLSWTTGKEWVEADRSEGAFIPNGPLVTGQVSARIDKYGPLLVKTPPTMDDWLKGSSNFHVWDYNLFWMDIRKNVAERIHAFANREIRAVQLSQ